MRIFCLHTVIIKEQNSKANSIQYKIVKTDRNETLNTDVFLCRSIRPTAGQLRMLPFKPH
jgi:hypothetical protein